MPGWRYIVVCRCNPRRSVARLTEFIARRTIPLLLDMATFSVWKPKAIWDKSEGNDVADLFLFKFLLTRINTNRPTTYIPNFLTLMFEFRFNSLLNFFCSNYLQVCSYKRAIFLPEFLDYFFLFINWKTCNSFASFLLFGRFILNSKPPKMEMTFWAKNRRNNLNIPFRKMSANFRMPDLAHNSISTY